MKLFKNISLVLFVALIAAFAFSATKVMNFEKPTSNASTVVTTTSDPGSGGGPGGA
jgi:hypothetical protein